MSLLDVRLYPAALGAALLLGSTAAHAQREDWTISARHPARFVSLAADRSPYGDAYVLGSTSNNTIYTGNLLNGSSGALSSPLIEEFGASVDLLYLNSTRFQGMSLIAVGAPASGQSLPVGAGRVVVFRITGSGTLAQQWSVSSPSPASYARFGESVAIGVRNNVPVLIVGEPGGGGSNRTGKAHVFVYSDTQDRWLPEQTLSPFSSSAAGDEFGKSVTFEGTRVTVGAPRNDAGGSDSGSVYFFSYDGVSYQGIHRFNPPGAGGRCGSCVAQRDHLVAVGAPEWNRGNGRVDLFDLNSLSAPVYTVLGDELGKLGSSVDVNTQTVPKLLIGKRFARSSGAVELHERIWGSWTKQSDWQRPSFGLLANFGWAVAFGRDTSNWDQAVFVLTPSVGQGYLTRYSAPPVFEPHRPHGGGVPGYQGLVPPLEAVGRIDASHRLLLSVTRAYPLSPGVLVLGTSRIALPLLGGILGPRPDLLLPITSDAFGEVKLDLILPEFVGVSGLFLQALFLDPGAARGLSMSDTLLVLAS